MARIENSTNVPSKLIRRVNSWACKEVEVSPRKIKRILVTPTSERMTVYRASGRVYIHLASKKLPHLALPPFPIVTSVDALVAADLLEERGENEMASMLRRAAESYDDVLHTLVGLLSWAAAFIAYEKRGTASWYMAHNLKSFESQREALTKKWSIGLPSELTA